ncbi:cell-division initiation protein DivIVA [Clostridium pasteurianum DSM 525 = ATCC 6013]|uniref:Cell-division initiation protein DivIVA n=1 Tax=Clostridium pasteurianum DSM 525 = ATCC 6013 TaxID=1262449 RepID=A0A0H3J1Z9_CLOPA|nr:DivIVA domain-containing protein [Clostridium pasteurianum]AJA47936.1 cell-division initiation protein DivIVA [Clostridium pasteurianum DSM 525 = ATCC 6013]AJA51924.1 cell-division initiation protein DivIVA [Clostridium pasteurianum DSM 525 = ATCC 6013]AOZ75223.1 cell division protein DivIVA [Clostridium pasteurianum DSM 525 = ATCC 6013]AOZ79018.1 cell division protein DivIVA [Clostridium pasteurianum]ELP59839.1 cell division protein DivIVA [Clostridium pasteurianum DSM 525 = ATCC 6013]
MRLTSMDINNKEFKKVLRGYDQDEVDEFLDKIGDNYEEIYKENSALKEKVSILNEKIDHYLKIEETIQNTLILAQNAAEQAKQSAKKEAELIIKNANDTSQRIIDKANSEVIKISDDYETIKQEFIKFRAKYRNFMNTQLDMFNDLEMDFEKNYNIINEKEIKEKEIENYEDKSLSTELKALDDKEENFNDDLNEIKSFFVKE